MSYPPSQDDALAWRRELYDLVTQYRVSAIFLASLDLDLYSHIPPEGASAEQLAKAVDCDAHGLGLLLEALVAIGLLSGHRGEYHLPPEVGEFLIRGAGSFADFLLLQRTHFRSWLDLKELVCGTPTEAAPEAGILGSPELVSHYLDLIGANNHPIHKAIASHLAPALREAGRVLDIGGGHGRFAQMLSDEYPNLRVWVVDLKAVIDCGRSRVGTAERIEFVTGDARTFKLDGEFDVVTLNDMLHYFSTDEKRQVVARACRRLRSGGTIAVCEFRLDGEPAVRAGSALFSFRMFADTHKGYVGSGEEIRGLLREAGVEDISELALSGSKVAFVGRRRV